MERKTRRRSGWWGLGMAVLLGLAVVPGARSQAPATIKYGAPTWARPWPCAPS